jgi:hypothetical protein
MHAPFPQKVRWFVDFGLGVFNMLSARCSLLMIIFLITLCLTLINQVLQQSFYERQLKTSHGTTMLYVSTLVNFCPFFIYYYFWLGIRHRCQRQDGTSQRHHTRRLCVLKTNHARYCAEHHQLQQHQRRHRRNSIVNSLQHKYTHTFISLRSHSTRDNQPF